MGVVRAGRCVTGGVAVYVKGRGLRGVVKLVGVAYRVGVVRRVVQTGDLLVQPAHGEAAAEVASPVVESGGKVAIL